MSICRVPRFLLTIHLSLCRQPCAMEFPMKRQRRQKRRGGARSAAPSMPASIDAEVTIDDLGHRGDGVATHDGRRVFIAGALPGERVRVRLTGPRGHVVEVLEASPDRVPPGCDHDAVCGGCAVRHMREDAYRVWKRGLVVAALDRCGLDAPVDPLIDAHGEGRRRVTLHVGFEAGRVRVGFMRAHSRDLFELHSCPVLAPALADAAGIAATAALPFAARRRPLDIRFTATETGLDVNIASGGEMSYDRQVALAACADVHDLARLSLDGDLVVERRQPLLTMGAAKVSPPAGGFLQATRAGEAAIADLVAAHLDLAASAQMADLFCGIGPFALRAASTRTVFAADSDAAAVAALTQALRFTANLKSVTTAVRNLSNNPLMAEELAAFDAVVFDPPRAGAEDQAREFATSSVPTVVAVSCDPATFARDAEILCRGGYTLQRVTPVDQFKFTAHVEVVGLFRRA